MRRRMLMRDLNLVQNMIAHIFGHFFFGVINSTDIIPTNGFSFFLAFCTDQYLNLWIQGLGNVDNFMNIDDIHRGDDQ